MEAITTVHMEKSSKSRWKISIPHFDLYGYTTAGSSRQAVLFMLKRMVRERPWMKGKVQFALYTENSEDFATLVE